MERKLRAFRCVLLCFEAVLGLHINLTKSEINSVGCMNKSLGVWLLPEGVVLGFYPRSI